MPTIISTSCWGRTYWVLRRSKFCSAPPIFANLGDLCPIKLSALLSQLQPAQYHINYPTSDTSDKVCVTFLLNVISFNLFTKLQIKTIPNPLCFLQGACVCKCFVSYLQRAWHNVSAQFVLCGYSCSGSTRSQQHAMGGQRGLIVACLKSPQEPLDSGKVNTKDAFRGQIFSSKEMLRYIYKAWLAFLFHISHHMV